jgi:7-cyano-7-deazaguanine synthase
MIDKEVIAKRTGKKVLLFSSGMDSYIINQLEKPDVLLFIDNTSKYSQIEKERLESLNYKNIQFVENFIDMSSIELSNMIMPARNLYFVTIASYFGEEIILGATAGDRSTDKDEKFAELSSALLSHINTESHWCSKGDVNVNLKYKKWSKQMLVEELVRVNLAEGISTEETVRRLVFDSFSCYHPLESGEQCNRCKPDTRKYLAILGATGINIDKYYEDYNKPSDYFTPEVVEQLIKDHSGENGRGIESTTTLQTIKRYFL